jgi:hypothetical protein
MSEGNWMNIKYNTRFQFQKALSKNGKIFDNNMMIGVVETIDQKSKKRKREDIDILKKNFVSGDDLILRKNNTIKRQKLPEKEGFFSKVFDFLFKF